jgi:hypothetical protein
LNIKREIMMIEFPEITSEIVVFMIVSIVIGIYAERRIFRKSTPAAALIALPAGAVAMLIWKGLKSAGFSASESDLLVIASGLAAGGLFAGALYRYFSGPRKAGVGPAAISKILTPTVLFKGVSSYETACDIFHNKRFLVNPSYSIAGVWMTDRFDLAKEYAGINGYIIELSISPGLDLHFSENEYVAEVPNAEPNTYYTFPEQVTPVRVWDRNNKAIFHKEDYHVRMDSGL